MVQGGTTGHQLVVNKKTLTARTKKKKKAKLSTTELDRFVALGAMGTRKENQWCLITAAGLGWATLAVLSKARRL